MQIESYTQALVTENERTIYKKVEEREQKRSYGIFQTQELNDFMLKIPKPIKKDIKFGVFHMGKIKGTLRRKDLYADR